MDEAMIDRVGKPDPATPEEAHAEWAWKLIGVAYVGLLYRPGAVSEFRRILDDRSPTEPGVKEARAFIEAMDPQ